MAEERKIKNVCAKISKNSQDTVHLETLKVSQTVHKLLLDDLRKKKKLWIKIWEGLMIRKGSVVKQKNKENHQVRC